MKQISDKVIQLENKSLNFEYPIKKILEYENIFIVLIKNNKEIPNNIIAFDYNGNEKWKVNDIVKAKILRGYYDIEKKSDTIISAYYYLGIIFDIDIIKNEILNETYLR